MDPIFRCCQFYRALSSITGNQLHSDCISSNQKSRPTMHSGLKSLFLLSFSKCPQRPILLEKNFQKSHLQGALNLLILVSANRWLTVNPRRPGNSQIAFVDIGVQLGQHPSRQLDKHAESKRHSTAAMHFSQFASNIMCRNSFRHRIKLHKF